MDHFEPAETNITKSPVRRLHLWDKQQFTGGRPVLKLPMGFRCIGKTEFAADPNL
jgi:hypothetical protein